MSFIASKRSEKLLRYFLVVTFSLLCFFSIGFADDFRGDKGYVNHTGYEAIGWPDQNGISIVMKDGLYGLINEDGTVIAETTYQKIYNFQKPHLRSSAEYGCYVVEGDGFTGCLFSDGGFVRHNPDWNTDGTSYFSGDTMIIQNKDTGASNFVDRHGKLIFDQWWEKIYPQKNGGGVAKSGDHFSLISHTGTVLFSFTWEGTISCCEEMIILHGKKAQKSLAISAEDGRIVVPAEYDYLDPRGYSHGFLLFMKENKYGYLNEEGKVAIHPQFDDAYAFVNDLAIVKLNGTVGCIDMDGNMLFSFSSSKKELVLLENMPDVIKFYEKDGASRSWGFLNRDGEIISVFGEEMEGYTEVITSEGVFPVTDPFGKAGYMNVYGQWVIEPQWDVAGAFINGYAFVEIDSLCGVIDQSGDYIITPKFLSGEKNFVIQDQIFFLVRLEQSPSRLYIANVEGEIIAPYLWNR